MAKGFTVLSIKALGEGKISDPATKGLYHWRRGNSRIWLMKYTWRGKPIEMSLGPVARVGLAEARDKVAIAWANIAKGIDPKTAKVAPIKAVTFRDDYLAYHAKKKGSWDATHATYWLQTMERYAGKIANRDTATLTADDIAAVIEPIWQTKNPTALRLHGQITVTIRYAMDLDNDDSRFGGKRNPADKVLASPRLPEGFTKAQVNHPTIPWCQAPALYKALGAIDSQPARALQWLMLLGTPRAAEVIGALWGEIDNDVFHVPSERMKSGKARDIPLTKAAVDLLGQVTSKRDGYIFTGRKGKTIGGTNFGRKREKIGGTFVEFSGHMHQDAMQILLREELKMPVHVHGLRSTYRAWVADNTQLATDWEAGESCLAHSTANQVQRAYIKSDRPDYLISERRALLERWAEYLTA